VLVAQNAAEVAAIVTDLDEKRALRIGSAARKRVLAEHTYGRRAAEVERIFDLAFQT
jgi:spore maturation protein CgeB